jgi:hypothetical protein
MKANKNRICEWIVLISAVGVLVTGCASSIDRGSLSDAVDKAGDDYDGDRRVVGKSNSDRNEDGASSCLSSCLFGGTDGGGDDDVAVSTGSSQESEPCMSDFAILPGYYGLRVLTSNRFSRNYTNATGIGLLWVNHYKERRAFEASVQCEVITTDEKSKLFGSVNGIIDLETGIHGRRYSTPDFTVMGLYLKYGCNLNFLFWEYRNPVESVLKDEQGRVIEIDTIKTDGLFGFDADIGLGWSFVQTKRVKISAELLAGGTLFWFQTFEAFRNDMFMPDGFIKIGIEILFGTGDR